MTAPAMETLTLSSIHKDHFLHALLLLSDTRISPEAQQIRKKFRNIKLYECIYTNPLAVAFVEFVTGKIQENDESIVSLKKDLEDRFSDQDFSTSVTAMMQIIRQELGIKE